MKKYNLLFFLLLFIFIYIHPTRANEIMIEPHIRYYVNTYTKTIPVAHSSNIRVAGSSDIIPTYYTDTYKYYYAHLNITQNIDNLSPCYYQFYFRNTKTNDIINRIIEIYPSETDLVISLGCSKIDDNNTIYHFVDFAKVN